MTGFKTKALLGRAPASKRRGRIGRVRERSPLNLEILEPRLLLSTVPVFPVGASPTAPILISPVPGLPVVPKGAVSPDPVSVITPQEMCAAYGTNLINISRAHFLRRYDAHWIGGNRSLRRTGKPGRKMDLGRSRCANLTARPRRISKFKGLLSRTRPIRPRRFRGRSAS